MSIGPINDLDDVKWSLGDWLFGHKKGELSAAQMRQLMESARELGELVELNLKLREVTERCYAVNYFNPESRNEIRSILDKMDAVSAGTHTTMRRRNETLSNLEKNNGKP